MKSKRRHMLRITVTVHNVCYFWAGKKKSIKDRVRTNEQHIDDGGRQIREDSKHLGYGMN